MATLDMSIVEKFAIAAGSLIQLRAPPSHHNQRVTAVITYAPNGFVTDEDLIATTKEKDIDVIHLEFEPGREFEGPANVRFCENRNGTILAWPKCNLWADETGRLVLVVPERKDFGFAMDGIAIVRVTDLDTGADRDRGISEAHAMLMSSALRVSDDIPRERHSFHRRASRKTHPRKK